MSHICWEPVILFKCYVFITVKTIVGLDNDFVKINEPVLQ